MGSRPTHRVTISRKDGKEITFTDYKGEAQTRKFAPIGALFPSRLEGGFSLALDKKVTLDPETLWINIYPIDMRREERDDSGEEAPASRRGGRRTGGRKAASEPLFDGDDASGDLPG